MGARNPYQRPVQRTTWFLGQARYKSYMLHEVSSLFVGLYMWLLIDGLFRLANGPDAWNSWLSLVRSWPIVILSVIAFMLFLIHTKSWFDAVPQAMRIQRGEEFVPGKVLIGANYAALGAFSILILVLAGVA